VKKVISKQMIVGGVVGAIAVTALGATAGYRMLDPDSSAKVISATPVTEMVSVPGEECRDQLVSVQRATNDPNQIAGTVAGAVIGGLAGSQVGGGDGKKVATVGGVVAGGYAGKRIQEGMQDRNVDQVNERVCETTQTTTLQNVGYDVTYLLDGQEVQVRMSEDPGSRIPLENGKPVIE
jgi:uncharacterized protein YcfJ